MEITSDDQPVLEILQQVGFSDPAKLRGLLTSAEPNMAKVFFFMLTQKHDTTTLPWDGSSSGGPIFYEHSFGAEQWSDLSHGFAESRSLGSFGASFENATLFLPEAALPTADLYDESIPHLATNSVKLMTVIEQFLRIKHFEFLVPDDRSLYARNQTLNVCLCVRATYEGPETMSVKVHDMGGARDQFVIFVRQLKQLLLAIDGNMEDMESFV